MSSNTSTAGKGPVPPPTSWAVQTYLPDSEFEILRPKMAMQFPFELDVFQKQVGNVQPLWYHFDLDCHIHYEVLFLYLCNE